MSRYDSEALGEVFGLDCLLDDVRMFLEAGWRGCFQKKNLRANVLFMNLFQNKLKEEDQREGPRRDEKKIS